MRQTSRLVSGLLLFVLACSARRPRDIVYGGEGCNHCHMTIADPRFSAELLTRTGKALTFDDVGCMARWLAENPAERSTAWVVSFVDGEWLPAETAIFLKSNSFHTPMSSGLAALRPGVEADSIRAIMGGELLQWSAVRSGTHAHVAATPGS